MSATTTSIESPAPARQGVFRRLYYGQTRFDFIRKKKIWFTISALIVIAGAISLATRGLNFNIEFVGGTSWQVPANGVTVNQARTALTAEGLGGSTITLLGSGSNQQIQVEARLGTTKDSTNQNEADKVAGVLSRLTHHSSASSVTVQQVGPTWGSQITNKAITALIVFFILIAVYISIFFEWKMALAAIIAVVHDILITVGIYSLSGFLVTPDTVVAFLTILGYSLYDTIVVFDRVRDNTKGLGASGKLSFTDVVNLSMNQTLARSINTSLVAILPILAVLVLGADILGATTLEYFGLALLIGLACGAYSSIFIASPLVAMLKEREPRYVQIRNRLEARGTAALLLTPAAVAAGALSERDERGGSKRRRRAGIGGSGPLRPSGGGAILEPAIAGIDEDDVPEPEGARAKPPARPERADGAAKAQLSNRAGAAKSKPGGGSRPGQPRPRKKRRR
ncbi:MAG: protein translocase subunit SecF [Acidimicrobiales bacterium]